MSQWWRDLTFVHWRVDPDLLAPVMPVGVRPDLFDGSAWVGLVPFRMVDAAPGHGGPTPWLGTFLETNVRTYSLDDRGRHGVVFCSLDANRLAVVAAANASLGLPYRWARISCHPEALLEDPTGQRLRYDTARRTGRRPRSVLEVEVGDPIERPSPLQHFLTARFGLHTSVLGRTLWVPNTHGPWPLREARALLVQDELVTAAGLPEVTTSPPDSVLFSPGVHTVFGLPQRL